MLRLLCSTLCLLLASLPPALAETTVQSAQSRPPGGQETLPPARASATADQVEETLQALAERGALTVRALIAYDRLPASLRGELLQLRSQGVDILGQDATGLQRLLEESRDRLTPQQRAAMGRLLDALQAVTAPPSADAAVAPGEFPPLPEPVPMRLAPDTDLRSLGAERYAGMVSLAKEAVAELLGVMDTAQQQAFDQLWQPMYAFPAPECITYLEKVIPLVEQALSLRTAVIEGTKQTSELWHAAAIAAQYDEQAASSIFQRIHLQTASLQGHKETLNALLDELQGLGQPPDPNALQKAAQDRHQRAMRTLESLVQSTTPLEGYYEQLSGLEYLQGVQDALY